VALEQVELQNLSQALGGSTIFRLELQKQQHKVSTQSYPGLGPLGILWQLGSQAFWGRGTENQSADC
jgi:hypothetical protein